MAFRSIVMGAAEFDAYRGVMTMSYITNSMAISFKVDHSIDRTYGVSLVVVSRKS